MSSSFPASLSSPLLNSLDVKYETFNSASDSRVKGAVAPTSRHHDDDSWFRFRLSISAFFVWLKLTQLHFLFTIGVCIFQLVVYWNAKTLPSEISKVGSIDIGWSAVSFISYIKGTSSLTMWCIMFERRIEFSWQSIVSGRPRLFILQQSWFPTAFLLITNVVRICSLAHVIAIFVDPSQLFVQYIAGNDDNTSIFVSSSFLLVESLADAVFITWALLHFVGFFLSVVFSTCFFNSCFPVANTIFYRNPLASRTLHNLLYVGFCYLMHVNNNEAGAAGDEQTALMLPTNAVRVDVDDGNHDSKRSKPREDSDEHDRNLLLDSPLSSSTTSPSLSKPAVSGVKNQATRIHTEETNRDVSSVPPSVNFGSGTSSGSGSGMRRVGSIILAAPVSAAAPPKLSHNKHNDHRSTPDHTLDGAVVVSTINAMKRRPTRTPSYDELYAFFLANQEHWHALEHLANEILNDVAGDLVELHPSHPSRQQQVAEQKQQQQNLQGSDDKEGYSALPSSASDETAWPISYPLSLPRRMLAALSDLPPYLLTCSAADRLFDQLCSDPLYHALTQQMSSAELLQCMRRAPSVFAELIVRRYFRLRDRSSLSELLPLSSLFVNVDQFAEAVAFVKADRASDYAEVKRGVLQAAQTAITQSAAAGGQVFTSAPVTVDVRVSVDSKASMDAGSAASAVSASVSEDSTYLSAFIPALLPFSAAQAVVAKRLSLLEFWHFVRRVPTTCWDSMAEFVTNFQLWLAYCSCLNIMFCFEGLIHFWVFLTALSGQDVAKVLTQHDKDNSHVIRMLVRAIISIIGCVINLIPMVLPSRSHVRRVAFDCCQPRPTRQGQTVTSAPTSAAAFAFVTEPTAIDAAAVNMNGVQKPANAAAAASFSSASNSPAMFGSPEPKATRLSMSDLDVSSPQSIASVAAAAAVAASSASSSFDGTDEVASVVPLSGAPSAARSVGIKNNGGFSSVAQQQQQQQQQQPQKVPSTNSSKTPSSIRRRQRARSNASAPLSISATSGVTAMAASPEQLTQTVWFQPMAGSIGEVVPTPKHVVPTVSLFQALWHFLTTGICPNPLVACTPPSPDPAQQAVFPSWASSDLQSLSVSAVLPSSLYMPSYFPPTPNGDETPDATVAPTSSSSNSEPQATPSKSTDQPTSSPTKVETPVHTPNPMTSSVFLPLSTRSSESFHMMVPVADSLRLASNIHLVIGFFNLVVERDFWTSLDWTAPQSLFLWLPFLLQLMCAWRTLVMGALFCITLALWLVVQPLAWQVERKFTKTKINIDDEDDDDLDVCVCWVPFGTPFRWLSDFLFQRVLPHMDVVSLSWPTRSVLMTACLLGEWPTLSQCHRLSTLTFTSLKPGSSGARDVEVERSESESNSQIDRRLKLASATLSPRDSPRLSSRSFHYTKDEVEPLNDVVRMHTWGQPSSMKPLSLSASASSASSSSSEIPPNGEIQLRHPWVDAQRKEKLYSSVQQLVAFIRNRHVSSHSVSSLSSSSSSSKLSGDKRGDGSADFNQEMIEPEDLEAIDFILDNMEAFFVSDVFRSALIQHPLFCMALSRQLD